MTRLWTNRYNLLATIALTATLMGGITPGVEAQSNPGLTIFSGVEQRDILNYHLDFGGRAGGWDRYRLRIPGKKLTQGVSKFFVVYPDYYKGEFDPKAIEVRVQNEPLPLEEVIWDKESRIVEIVLKQPLLESRQVEIVFSNVKNPDDGGTYYFQGQILTAGQIPLRLSVGTWILSIN